MPAESLAAPNGGLTTTVDGAQARPALRLPALPPAVAATVEGALNSYTQVLFAHLIGVLFSLWLLQRVYRTQ